MAQALAIAGLNGEFLPLAEARITPLDRGFLFGDAVYEVVPVYAGKPALLDAHLARLGRSMAAIGIDNPNTDADWRALIDGLIERNGSGTMSIYIQVSRGADAGRDQTFGPDLRPTVFAMATELEQPDYSAGVSAILLPDERWDRCDIKSTALLANVMARQKAAEAGALDAILTDEGFVTEGAVSSVLIVEQNCIVRRPHGHEVLPGTTTDHVVALASAAGYRCSDEKLSVERLLSADEIWLTGATKGIAPVVRIDGQVIGGGRPGPVWTAVSRLYEADQHDG